MPGHQRIQPLSTCFFVDGGKIGKLHLADDLHSFRVKVFIKAHQLQAGTGHIVFVNENFCRVFRHIDGFQMKFVNNFSQ